MQLHTRYTKVTDIFADLADNILVPAERISVSEAAEKYRKINNPGSYVGDWSNKKTPYLVEYMDVLTSREFTGCVFAGPAQSGKTDAGYNWIGYGIKCDPADFILYEKSQTAGRDSSKRRVDRLHQHSPAFGEQLLPSRDADNTFDKFYRNGTILTISWPSKNELAGRPIGRVWLTDYDRMPQDVDGEGSPFDLGRKRTTTFGSFAMTLAESSPSFESEDPKWREENPHEPPPCQGIISLYARGDRRLWYWPCIHCGKYYEPRFRLLHLVGSTDHMESAEATQMECPHCHKFTPPERKQEISEQGVWVKQGQRVTKTGKVVGQGIRSDIASFWLKGPAATFISWKSLVLNYLKAVEEFERTGSQSTLKTTTNTDQAEVFFRRSNADERLPEDIQERAYELPEKEVPPDCRFLVGTVDVQKNCFKVQVQGPGPDKDHYIIDRFEIQKSKRFDKDGDRLWVSPHSYPEDWGLITDQVIKKTYPLADGSGRRMRIKIVGCDAYGKKGVTKNAYNYYRRIKRLGLAARFKLIKGEPNENSPIARISYPDSDRKDRKAGARGEIPVLFLNSNALKDQLDRMLDRIEPGEGFIHFPEWLPDWFFAELCAEERTNKGWENPKGLRNESTDLAYIYLGLLAHLEKAGGLSWTRLPKWAAEHDKNTLVFGPDEKQESDRKEDIKRSIEELADQLA